MNDQAVGIFDSGVGGLSVLKHVHELLPNETIFVIIQSDYINNPFSLAVTYFSEFKNSLRSNI